MGSNFDENGEESETHPVVKNLDDASEYVPIWGVTKERVLAPFHLICRHCHESFRVCKDCNRLVVGERVFEGQACCRKFGTTGRADCGTSTHPAASPPLVSCQ